MQKNLGTLIKKLAQMQANMNKVKESLDNELVTGEAAGGMVKVTVTAGSHKVSKVNIDPLLLDEDVDLIEDSVAAAMASAVNQANALAEAKMKGATDGMLPFGMKLPGLG